MYTLVNNTEINYYYLIDLHHTNKDFYLFEQGNDFMNIYYHDVQQYIEKMINK